MQDPAAVLPPAVEIGIDLAITAIFTAYGIFVLTRRSGTTAVAPGLPVDAGVGSAAPGQVD
jgi:hypothetical protein